jgi:hypothetical protein
VVEVTVTELAATAPKATVSLETKLVPVTVTMVPPDDGPEFGLTALTVGAGAEPPPAT